jgi:hypothetical protein
MFSSASLPRWDAEGMAMPLRGIMHSGGKLVQWQVRYSPLRAVPMRGVA